MHQEQPQLECVVSAMRYFSNIRPRGVLLADPDGTEVVSIDAARVEAVAAARELVADRLKRGEVLNGDAIEISGESGTLLETVPFMSVFRRM